MKHQPARLLPVMVLLICLIAASARGFAADPANRVVSINSDTKTYEVSTYFISFSHGHTQKFFLLPEKGVVVVVATKRGTSQVSAEINVFPLDTSGEQLDRWRNNQHSDGLYPDAPMELRTIIVPPQYFHSTVSSPLDHEVGRIGEEYDRVRVDFSVDRFTDGDVTVEPFRGSLDAFVLTKEPRLR